MAIDGNCKSLPTHVDVHGPEVPVPGSAGTGHTGFRPSAVRIAAVSIAVLVSFALPSHADGSAPLAVLGQDRGAVPAEAVIGELLARFLPDPEDDIRIPDPRPVDSVRVLRQTGYPFFSSLIPDAAKSGLKEIDMPLANPVCVVGPDAISQRWLAANRIRLMEMGAGCVLVAARGPVDLERVRRAARPLMVQAVPFDDLAARHGIRTVPVLLVGRGNK